MRTENDINIFWQRQINSPIRLGIYFKAGGIYQKKGSEGIAHLSEHLLLSNPKLKELSDKYFLTFSAYTTLEFIYLHITLPHHPRFLNTIWPEIINFIYEIDVTEESISLEVASIKAELANFATDYPNTNQVLLHNYLATHSSQTENMGLVEGGINNTNWTPAEVKDYINKHLKKPSSIVLVGDIEGTRVNIGLLVKPFERHPSEPPLALRLRKELVAQKTVIQDIYRKESQGYSCLGIGWSQEFNNPRLNIAMSVFFGALANPAGRLYKSLRKEGLVYEFLLDQDVIAKQISIFSIHTLVPEHTKERFINIIEEYLQNTDEIRKDVQWQLDYYKKTAAHIYDGSQEIFNFYNYYQRISLMAEDYEEIIGNMTTDEVLHAARDISMDNSVLLVS